MAQQTKHTELQWTVDAGRTPLGETGDYMPYVLIMGEGLPIAMMSEHFENETTEANAEMIVKAVNNHDKLVDMLKLVLKEKYRESNGSIQNTEIETMAENLLQSLKD
jgi:hypothetical protein